MCHQLQSRAAQGGDPESQGSTPEPVAQGDTPQSLDTLWHPPHLIFLLGVSSVMKFFLSSKISQNFISKFNFLFVSGLLSYSFRRILKGCYPIQLPELDKYWFCSKVHRKQHRTNLSSPFWDQQIHTSNSLFHS